VVGGGDLVNAGAGAGHLRHDFGLEAETVLLDFHGLDQLPAERLVARLHVREVQVGRHVGKEREETVPRRVPEIEHPVRARADEARAENRIRLSGEDRCDERGVFRRVVFEVGILDQNHGCRGVLDAGADGCALALVFAVPEHAQARFRGCERQQDLQCPVGRTIVHGDHFGHAGLGESGGERTRHGGFFIVGGKHHTHLRSRLDTGFHGGHHCSQPRKRQKNSTKRM